MKSRKSRLCREFVAYTKAILERNPQIRHTWSIDTDEDHCILNLPSSSPNGFDVTVEVDQEQITVFPHGLHEHFELRDDYKVIIEDAMGLVRDLLSPSMRIREYLSSGSPYKWDAEIQKDEKWERENTTCLMFWNYFGTRSERFYQNHTLEKR